MNHEIRVEHHDDDNDRGITTAKRKSSRIDGLIDVAKSKGIRLKRFEQVVANLLTRVLPSYTKLPERLAGGSDRGDDGNAAEDADDDWPFGGLPAGARVFGDLPGQLTNLKRARKKEQQLRSMLQCIFALLPAEVRDCPSNATNISQGTPASTCNTQYAYTIVDFGGGSGHLAIPLALLLPSARVIVVDLGERSLQLCHVKAAQCNQKEGQGNDTGVQNTSTPTSIPLKSNVIQPCDGIFNLYTYFGPLQTFTNTKFDFGIALHLCGEATDVAFRLAGQQQASVLVFAPCCVGKTSVMAKNPYIWQATGSNLPTVTYPQSKLFCQLLAKTGGGDDDSTHPTNQDLNRKLVVNKDSEGVVPSWEEDWSALAKAADYSQMDEFRTSRNAARRTAKALLETDRRLFLEESYGYSTALTRMNPWEATPKNDILLAWRRKRVGDGEHGTKATTETKTIIDSEEEVDQDCQADIQLTVDQDCQADIQLTVDHLLRPTSKPGTDGSVKAARCDNIDWTADEENGIRGKLLEFISQNPPSSNAILCFPARMGGRKRKLIHFVAEDLDLAHWCRGDKEATKTVAVSRRGMGRRT